MRLFRPSGSRPDLAILNNRRATALFSFVILAGLLVLLLLFGTGIDYMHYAPPKGLANNPPRSLPGGYWIDMTPVLEPRGENRYASRWGWTFQARHLPAYAEEITPGNFLDYLELPSDARVRAARYWRLEDYRGVEVLWQNEALYGHTLALVEGMDDDGHAPSGAKMLLIRMRAPLRNKKVVRENVWDMIGSLRENQVDPERVRRSLSPY